MKQALKEFGPGALALAAMLVANQIYGPVLPDQVPIHFNIHGEPDNYASASRFLYILPGIFVATMLGISTVLRLSPKFFSMPNSRDILGSVYLGVGGLLAAIHIGLLVDPEGGSRFSFAMGLGVPFFLLVFGNLMGKLERNFLIGIRLPWTIASDDNWAATHRFSGRLMVLSGIGLGISTFVFPTPISWIVAIVVPLLAGCVYSFQYYWTKERNIEGI
jgi:immunity protein, SdpI family